MKSGHRPEPADQNNHHQKQEIYMPAKSKAQQRAAGAALSAKRGETKVGDLKGASKDMYDSMSEKELEDFASTDHDGLPDKVEDDD
tara:strand:- start:9627 stop:9884 length:258 start_codon:yes stop_codon:yes gene_type:complete